MAEEIDRLKKLLAEAACTMSDEGCHPDLVERICAELGGSVVHGEFTVTFAANISIDTTLANLDSWKENE